MLRLYEKIKDFGAGDTGELAEEYSEDVETTVEEKKGEIVENGRYFSQNVAENLTHLTAEMEVFVGDCSTDYEDWKTVVNRIEQMKGIQYFACIRSPVGVFGKFSSVRPLGEALLAVLAPEESGIPFWFDALMSIAPVLFQIKEMIDLEKRMLEAQMVVAEPEPVVPVEESICWSFFTRMFSCFRRKRILQTENEEQNKIESRVDKVFTSLDK